MCGFRSILRPTGEQVVHEALDRSGGADKPRLRGNGTRTSKSRLVSLIQQAQGSSWVTGPTGSGKTTTLYGRAPVYQHTGKEYIDRGRPGGNIYWTGIGQITGQPEDTARFLPRPSGSFLRQDPDVIMVGEVPRRGDGENRRTGGPYRHLVFSTLHTNDRQARSQGSSIWV